MSLRAAHTHPHTNPHKAKPLSRLIKFLVAVFRPGDLLDTVRCETPEPGDLLAIREKGRKGVTAFGRLDRNGDEETGREYVIEEEDGECYGYRVASHEAFRVLSAKRTVTFTHGHQEGDGQAERERKIAEPRRRLNRLGEDDINDNTARFRIESKSTTSSTRPTLRTSGRSTSTLRRNGAG
jgi:hypothetical protein